MTPTFRPDPRFHQIAEAYYLDAIDVALFNFGAHLDGTQDSIQAVEHLLEQLHASIPVHQPDDETVWKFAKAFGSYVGEVMRKHHGGEWGMMTLEGGEFPAVSLPNGTFCWPWRKVYDRLRNGADDNVWHYYRVMTEPHAVS